MSATAEQTWVVEGQYTATIGWEVLTYCDSEAEANEMLSCYRTNEPHTPVRRRLVKL